MTPNISVLKMWWSSESSQLARVVHTVARHRSPLILRFIITLAACCCRLLLRRRLLRWKPKRALFATHSSTISVMPMFLMQLINMPNIFHLRSSPTCSTCHLTTAKSSVISSIPRSKASPKTKRCARPVGRSWMYILTSESPSAPPTWATTY